MSVVLDLRLSLLTKYFQDRMKNRHFIDQGCPNRILKCLRCGGPQTVVSAAKLFNWVNLVEVLAMQLRLY